MFEAFTRTTATPETLAGIGAPLCHHGRPGDVLSFRRLELEEGGLADVLVRHEARGGIADGTAVVYLRASGETRQGLFHAPTEDEEQLGVAEFEPIVGSAESQGFLLVLP